MLNSNWIFLYVNLYKFHYKNLKKFNNSMELGHSICAVDFGSWTYKISALTHNHRFEILVN